MEVTGISRRSSAVCITLLLCAVSASAQKSGASAPSTPSAPSRPPTTSPTPAPSNRPSVGTPSGPIFLSGRVQFDDGSPMNPNVRIERVCGATVRLESHTDSKGHFSFQVGQNTILDVDASDGNSGLRPGSMNSSLGNTNSPLGTGNGMGGFGSTGLSGCELRASYPGYRSDSLDLAGRQTMDSPDVGVIVLHRLGNVQGTTMSMTTLAAPKHAQKEYEKGMSLASKGKFEEAEQHLTEATSSYPQYAIAWFALGQMDHKQGRLDQARKDYEAAISADNHYVSPYDQLALLSAQQSKWEDAATFSQRAIELNPVEFPACLWYNAIANYNLKKRAEAEKSARQLIQLDTQHHFPGAEKMLAQLLLDKGNLTEAATHMRAYLAAAPNATDVGPMRELLTKVEHAQSQREQ